ncbi:V-type ATP synthase subunit F [Caloramator mitchellensis]|uniref:V-type ATP synthase subunit F n=1 Tax=Caloramator mitchellensis TaxID=908809 RepID=A0A0R3JY97_CALMK|nr:V-type ATP synthase subunit F [Caloramator mitchellensis]KRQ85900.1 V-type ATP synthase subunit F [Caloramator mitchellensis]
MRIYLISDSHDTFVGMRLSGIKGVLVNSASEAEEEINSILRDKEVGIIVLTERLSSQLKNLVDDIKLNRDLPLIVEIPNRHGSIKDKDYITGYIKESIGIRI